jgi:hypothetical protein
MRRFAAETLLLRKSSQLTFVLSAASGLWLFGERRRNLGRLFLRVLGQRSTSIKPRQIPDPSRSGGGGPEPGVVWAARKSWDRLRRQHEREALLILLVASRQEDGSTDGGT